MKPKSIGIVGGAGPLAGAFLLERIFSLCGKKYGCCRDADFPQVLLISFPFSEMLCPPVDSAKVQSELSGCLNHLRRNGADILAIACNTLHAFLDEKDDREDLVHLPRILANEGPLGAPLVLCTSTSANFGLHRRFMPCIYPEANIQHNVDEIIDLILGGVSQSVVLPQLQQLIQSQTAETIILGCTELSLYSPHLCIPSKVIIDPLEVMADKLVHKAFS